MGVDAGTVEAPSASEGSHWLRVRAAEEGRGVRTCGTDV